jgi:iron complex transport system ATP-binding protein
MAFSTVSRPEISLEKVSFTYPGEPRGGPVFERLSLELPPGITTLVGPNGTGKSTLLLLAAGILLPAEGRVYLRGIDTRSLREEEVRQRHVSFIYQNMEFESGQSIAELLNYVHAHGFHDTPEPDLVAELIAVCELEKVLAKKTGEVSKGELQRTIIAFSLLYGSKIIMMDEPIFALQEYQKHRIMDYMSGYSRRRGISVYYSVHELDISERYSDSLLLFYKSGRLRLGPTASLFKRENIEQAYQVPYTMLKRKEAIFREALQKRPPGDPAP